MVKTSLNCSLVPCCNNTLFITRITPFVQKQVNRHTNYTDLAAIVFYLTSFFFLALTLFVLLRYKNWQRVIIYLIVFLNFSLWANELQSLICDSCAKN